MKNLVAILSAVALSTGLVACDGGTTSTTPTAKSSMDDMDMRVEPRKVGGTGTITAIDMDNARVTIDHGDIAELEWPSMNMGFEAERSTLQNFSVGDRVDFEFDWDGRKGTLTRMAPAPQ